MEQRQKGRQISVLENKKLKETFGYQMADWEDALKKYLKDRKLIVKEQ